MVPYLGLTAKAALFEVNSAFFQYPLKEKISYLDELVASKVRQGQSGSPGITCTPFPLLGWPGWHPDNDNMSFYDNANYFRPKSTPVV